MARFENLNNNITDILLSVIGNQNLCKLIHLPNPINQPDIEDTSELLFTKIFPLPRIPEVSETAANFLNIYFADFKLSNSNAGVKSGSICFESLCHIDLWRIQGSGMLRPLSILHEIDNMINNERIVGVKKAQFNRCVPLFANNKYMGYRIFYDVVSGN